MRIYKIPFCLSVFFYICTIFIYSQTINPDRILLGTDTGLYAFDTNTDSGKTIPLWTNGEVKKILGPYTIQTDLNTITSLWYILTSEGIFSTTDLINFSDCNNTLSVKTIKEYDSNTKEVSFSTTITDLKDLEVHPQYPHIIVTANKDSVYFSRDAGKTWKSLGINARTTGVKAVAVASLPKNPLDSASTETEIIVFMSHPMYGLAWCRPDAAKIVWTDMPAGFEVQDSTSKSTDEISDIISVVHNGTQEIFLSQTFKPNLYRLDWQKKQGVLLWKGSNPADTIDSLAYTGNSLVFVQPEGVQSFDLQSKETHLLALTNSISRIQQQMTLSLYSSHINTLYLPHSHTQGYGNLSLSELWLLQPEKIRTPYISKIDQKKALYVPVGQISTVATLDPYIKTIKQNNLNTVVIDMKDDYGSLRYKTQDPLVKQIGYVSRYAIDLDPIVSALKAQDIYLIARIVVFKDRHLASYSGEKYAVWDKKLKTAWKGLRSTTKVTDDEGNETGIKSEYYDEAWVDPYSPEVWEYNIAVAKELISHGFDEIQFDYIRFPTDGLNLNDVVYRFQSPGMDKESALMSFLAYARKEIQAPIGIDIYGANGWYRSGARTGQDVELLAKYVDVICPMFYPSHFEQAFMAHKPASERPYRIYYYGSYRNAVIARNQVLIRPWAQAFFLDVSYDRVHYDKDYVQKQIFAIRDSIDNGYMYWNAVGRYSDVRPDVSDEPYKWTAFEADTKFRKPALSAGHK